MKPSEYFQEEVEWLHNPETKAFVLKAIDLFPPYFMINPASSSGRYHAKWSNTKGSFGNPENGEGGVAGGLAKHVKAVCHEAKNMMEAEMLTADEQDAVLVACVFHDSIKFGLGGGKHTVKEHESIGAVFYKRCTQMLKANIPLHDSIYTAVMFHQGRWAVSDPPKRFPEDFDRVGQAVHRADMHASRPDREYTFLGEEESLIG